MLICPPVIYPKTNLLVIVKYTIYIIYIYIIIYIYSHILKISPDHVINSPSSPEKTRRYDRSRGRGVGSSVRIDQAQQRLASSLPDLRNEDFHRRDMVRDMG